MSSHNFKVVSPSDRPRAKKPILSKPKSWTHQEDLRLLKGRRIIITTMYGDLASGPLLEADQFTIKLLCDASQSVVTYFKHGISSFRAE